MKIKFLISAFTFGFFLFLASKTIAKDSARFSLGIGVFNYMEDGSPPHNDQSGIINLEIQSVKKMFNLINPFAGFLGTNENAYMLMVALVLTVIMGKKRISL